MRDSYYNTGLTDNVYEKTMGLGGIWEVVMGRIYKESRIYPMSFGFDNLCMVAMACRQSKRTRMWIPVS